MFGRSVKAASAKIFEKLTNAKEYRNGFAKQKHRMITRLVAIQDELIQFAQTPDRRKHEVNGFLVEHCARFSDQLPKNTPKAQYLSEVIINHLHNSELSNPDYIWLKLQGRRMTFTGIGEVKSHPFNIAHRKEQLFFQETNIRNLIRCGDIPPSISKRYRVTLADVFVRYLILPRSTDAPHTLPASVPFGWEIKEIEFTFPEIIFLKRLLCSRTPPPQDLNGLTSSYSRKEYRSFVHEMTTQSEEIIADLFKNLLPDDQPRIRSDLALWGMIWNSIPANRKSIDLALNWIHEVTQGLPSSYSLIAKSPSSLMAFDAKKMSSCSLIQCALSDNASLTHALASRLEEIKQDFPNPPELPCKQEIDMFALL